MKNGQDKYLRNRYLNLLSDRRSGDFLIFWSTTPVISQFFPWKRFRYSPFSTQRLCGKARNPHVPIQHYRCATEWHPSLQPCSFSYRLFDESQEHEPPPPSPIPAAGPLRLLLRPLPTPEQSPVHVIHDTLPSRCASGCATPMTAYPSAPVPTPMTIEPIIMVYPLRSGQFGALSSVSEVISSTFASKKTEDIWEAMIVWYLHP